MRMQSCLEEFGGGGGGGGGGGERGSWVLGLGILGSWVVEGWGRKVFWNIAFGPAGGDGRLRIEGFWYGVSLGRHARGGAAKRMRGTRVNE
jgi:hypothetical protein